MSETSPTTTVDRSADGSRPAIGVCLSGGGFRAALFGLGALRYLAEAGRLGEVRAVSAVSGGSVAAAILADRWPELEREGFSVEAFDRHVVEPFLAVVTRKNLRNRGIGRWALTRVIPRSRRLGWALGATMVKQLLRARRVVELPRGLQVILTSTDLATGRAFRVSQEFIGGWEFGYSETPAALSLGTAIAASTAVPWLFPPVYVRTDGLGLHGDPPDELSLVDGGVYDNLGLEWFQGWDRGRPPAARACDFILVVDASGPLRSKPRHYGWARSILRSQAAQYTQTRTSRIRWFVEQLLDGKTTGLLVQIDKEPRRFKPPPGATPVPDAAAGAPPEGLAGLLSDLRTDLDRFLPEEAGLLLQHGYWSTHVRLVHVSPHLACFAPRWTDYGEISEPELDRLRRLLAAGRRRSASRR